MKLSFNRRGFLKKTSLAAVAAALGTEIVFADNFQKDIFRFVLTKMML